jgi:hypothetical protein
MKPFDGHSPLSINSDRVKVLQVTLELLEKLIKIGAKVVSHGRCVAFQMAELAIPRQMVQEIFLRLIAKLRPQPPPGPNETLDGMQPTGSVRPSADENSRSAARPPFGLPEML